MENCPVIKAIENNTVVAEVLPDFHAKGLESARTAADDCQGPGTIAVERQEGILLWSRKITEIRPACGYFAGSQVAVLETPQAVAQPLSGAQQPLSGAQQPLLEH